MRTNAFDVTALLLVIIGAVNWGLIGFFGFNLVAFCLGGEGSWFSRIVFALVGLAGLYAIKLFNSPKETAVKNVGNS